MSSGRALVAIAALALVGCYRDFVIAPRPGTDAGVRLRDAGPVVSDTGPRVPVPCAPTGVDLLFVIDNSNSMGAEQESLARQLPPLITALVDPPDDDGDGRPDWPAIPDLQVAVITTDMGSGGVPVPTCDSGTFGPDFGDDGILRTRSAAREGCAPSYPPVFRFAPGELGLVDQLACVTSTGTSGCGFEQQLEATLKALSPSAPTAYTTSDYAPPVFFGGTPGHGDRANEGFVREDAVLAIVILTDEDDCSASDPELYDPASPRYSGTDLNLRCFMHPDAVHPAARYVDGLLALRALRPELLALAVIAGIPADLAVDLPRAVDYDAILTDPRMTEAVDPTEPTRLRPSCNVPEVGIAFPPRRLVSVAAGLGEGRATVQSICQADLSAAVSPIRSLITTRACAAGGAPPL